MNPWLYTGTVAHKRIGAAAHAFRYPALFLCFPLSRQPELRNVLFSINRFNLFGFYDRDHGDGGDCQTWIRALLREHGLDTLANGEVWLQTQPRVLGFVFNPVSFWYCHDREDRLRVVLAEVNNTFGERHGYLLTAPDHGVIDEHTPLECRKLFHVSPFFPVEGDYRFRFSRREGRRAVSIQYRQQGQTVLKTSLTGDARPLTPAELLKALASLGWTTVLVVLRIHWQALKLWRKGARFHRKPAPPSMGISS